MIAQEEPAKTYKPDSVLVPVIRKAKVIATSYPVRVLRDGNEVWVTTLINPQSTDKSAKIDAVLVAKAIMDFDKKVLIVHYRVKEKMKDKGCLVVTVKQSDVMAYGVKAIGVDSLLGELKVVNKMGRRQSNQNNSGLQ
jgi:hypothetical protein